MKYIPLIILSIFLNLNLNLSIHAQSVPEPLFHEVYSFLGRLSQKGIVKFDDQIRPVSRKYIAEKLLEASTKLNDLTSLEKEELEFYKKDYTFEFESLNDSSKTLDLGSAAAETLDILGKDESDRYRLFSYSNDIFKLNVSPIVGYEAGINDKSYSHKWTGLYFYSYLSDHIGISFDYRDNTEIGDNADHKKKFTPVTGMLQSYSKGNSFDYSEARTSLTVDWSWGNFTIAKEFLEWGYGESGLLVLSRKAPSFPFIKLCVKPTDWLYFNYFHAWLNSDVLDSSSFYPTYYPGWNRETYKQKFLVSHSLNLTPFKGFDLTLGESLIYSDQLEIVYFMPLMFFRLGDHYLGQGRNSAGGNAQFFTSISSRNHIKNTHLYGSLLIDELTLSGLFDPKRQRTQIGFTFGGSVTGLPVNNLSVTLEYTKIYPFVYKHYIPTLTYANSGYVMGHWMGDNADLIYGALNYRFIRGLQATFWGEHIRKGTYGLTEGAIIQYDSGPQPPFLFGKRSSYTWGGIDAKYEITHELFARGRFVYNAVTEGNGPVKKANEIYLSVYYGL